MSDEELRCGYTRAWRDLNAAHRANLRACNHVGLMRAQCPAGRREALDAAYEKFERTKHAYLLVSDRLHWYSSQLEARGIQPKTCPASINPGCMACGRLLTMRQTPDPAEGKGSRAVEGHDGKPQVTSVVQVNSGRGMRLLDLEGRHDGDVTANTLSIKEDSPNERS